MKPFSVLLPVVFLCLYPACSNTRAQQPDRCNGISGRSYPFVKVYDSQQSVAARIAPPAGYTRVDVKAGSFACWLRNLPLKPGRPEVHLYNGQLKDNQNVHYAVVDADVGNSDLQQCADAVIRMRAEYLYSAGDYEDLHFNFTSGQTIAYKKWMEGYRPQVKGSTVNWVKNAPAVDNYASFRNYLQTIFMYAGTSSLSRELNPVTSPDDIRAGDVFITGGFPGHAVLVTDICENRQTHEKLFMIQQSYMPAQEIHILKNYTNSSISPWYSTNFAGDLQTPQWTFKKSQLMRFGPL